MPATAALELLKANVSTAARLAGLDIPPPVYDWQESNWLVGVRQRLLLKVDLRGVDPLPGVDMSLDLAHLRPAAVSQASPQAVVSRGMEEGLRWPLRLGAANTLEVHCWRWSPLGLGAIVILLVFLLVSMLGALRRQLGFGWPELPA